MAENKQYITQQQEHGRVMISEEVVATIALHSLSDIEGFAGLFTKPGADVLELIGKRNWGKGVKITVTDQETLMVECNILVCYGQSVVTVAKNVQTAVAAALESTTGAKVEGVNVNVCGIIRK